MITRQRQWQINQKRIGRCPQCGGAAVENMTLCVPCGLKARERARIYARKKYGKHVDAPIDRRGRGRRYDVAPIPDGAISLYDFRRELMRYIERGGEYLIWDNNKKVARVAINAKGEAQPPAKKL
jgi:hypothetical protein